MTKMALEEAGYVMQTVTHTNAFSHIEKNDNFFKIL